MLGFVIGAGLSLVGKRGPTQSVVVNTRATMLATEAPVTPAPTEPPTSPEPALKRSPQPTDAPTDIPSITAAPAKPSHATPHASPVSPAAVIHAPATLAPATNAPATHAPVTHAPTVVPTRVPVATKASVRPPVAAVAAAPATALPQLDAPAATDDTDSEFANLATAVVRQYIAAVARGDDATARAALGSDASGALAETGIVNASTRIQHIEAHSAGDNVTVNVDLRTSGGLYFGQYTVHRTSSGAALIANHAINKL